MGRILFNIDDLNKLKFKEVVGEKNISETLRNFIYSINKNSNSKEKEKELEQLKKDKLKIDIKINTLQSEIQRIKELNEKERIEKERLEKENLDFDPFPDLKNKSKLNAAQVLFYRVDNNRIIPDWAKKRDPKNPKDFALKLLTLLIEKLKEDKQ